MQQTNSIAFSGESETFHTLFLSRMTVTLLKTKRVFFFHLASRKHTVIITTGVTWLLKHAIQQERVIFFFTIIWHSKLLDSLFPLLRDISRYTYLSYRPVLSFYHQFHFYSVRFIKYPCVTLYLGYTCHASYKDIGFYELTFIESERSDSTTNLHKTSKIDITKRASNWPSYVLSQGGVENLYCIGTCIVLDFCFLYFRGY